MKKLPIVYVPRELLKRGETYYPYIAGYVVSEAYLKSEKKVYLEKGGVALEYEVEYIGYDKANEGLSESNFVIASGEFVKKNNFFTDYASCKEHSLSLNNALLRKRLAEKDVSEAVKIAEMQAVVQKLINALEETYLIDNESEEV